MTRLTNQDQDQVSGTFVELSLSKDHASDVFSFQEVKECAISCMGLVVSTFGDDLRSELPACLPVLVDRMGNEITRLTAVKVRLNSNCLRRKQIFNRLCDQKKKNKNSRVCLKTDILNLCMTVKYEVLDNVTYNIFLLLIR